MGFNVTDSSGNLAIQCDANSSLTTTILQIRFIFEDYTGKTVTVA